MYKKSLVETGKDIIQNYQFTRRVFLIFKLDVEYKNQVLDFRL